MNLCKLIPASVSILILLFSSLSFIPLQAADIEFPLLQSMSYFPYRDNDILAKGAYRTHLELHYSNIYTFNHYRTTFNDFESFSTTLDFRYGLTPGVTMEVFLRYGKIFGGVLDKPIEKFHSFFKLPDADRPDYPRNKVRYQFKDSFSYQESEASVSPLIIAFLKELFHNRHVSLKGRVAVGIPLSNKPGFSSNKPFYTGALVMNYHKKWFKLEFSNYLSLITQPTWLEGEEMRGHILLSRLQVNAFRFITGFVFRTSPFKEDDVSDNAYQIYIGYRITKNLELIFQEDFAPFNTTPDIGFNLRFRLL
jgi:Protein of unknown function (DUF3187)